MTKLCLSCGKETPMNDPKPGYSHGFCERTDPNDYSECCKAWMEWARIRGEKPSLRDYYEARKKVAA